MLRQRAFDRSIDRELAVIEKAAQDGRETVRRIQEFARTSQDRDFFPVDLSEILQDAIEMTRSYWDAEARRRNVQIRLETDTPSVSPILGKESELREVFTNLVLNAVDAMPRGGTLRVSCGEHGGVVRASVADSGVGMTEEIRRHLFDPFFTTKGQAGTGLGLSMVYGIIGRHDGEISVQTALGKGTKFVLEFPLAAERIVGDVVDFNEPETKGTPSRILVIDDEQDIVEILEEALRAEGHEVETALSGEDGLKKAAVSRYDLVFTDLGMPDLSGWDVAARLRDLRPPVPVVLVTGWGASIEENEVREHEISAVVHKPFELRDLVRTAALVLSRGETPGHPAAPSGAPERGDLDGPGGMPR